MTKTIKQTVLLLIFFTALTLPLFANRADDMYEAIQNFELDTVKRLVREGYPLNVPVKTSAGYDFYALVVASYCYGGSPSIVSYLLDMGADPNLHEPGEYNALMWAIRSIDEPDDSDAMRKQVFRMIQLGADVTLQDETTGRTPLHGAAGLGDIELVRELLRRGADPTLEADPYWTGGTPAEYARLGGHMLVALELEGGDITAYKRTLQYAAKSGDLAQVRRLVNQGADVNYAEERSGYTALYYAAEEGHLDVAEFLLQNGADPNVQISYGTTPLREAIVTYNEEMVILLAEHGATAHHEQLSGCGGGMTEFDWAISYNHKYAIILVEMGAVDLNIQNGLSNLYGYYDWEVEFARFLIDHGAEATEANIDYLRSRESNEIIEQLITLFSEAESDMYPPLPFSAPPNDPVAASKTENRDGLPQASGNTDFF